MRARWLAALLAAVALVATAVQPASAGPAIVGGGEADQDYPFTVSLHSASGKVFCAGSLIAPTWVVTAGHCVQNKSAAVLSARIGSNDSGQGGETAQPAELLVNPNYNASGAGGDIALVRLTSPVKAPTIAIGTSASPGTATRLLGWGQTCPAQSCGQVPTKLQQLDTQIVDGARCTAAFDGKVELCTDNPGGKAGSCYGDSGGPQLAKVDGKWVLLGVTSRPGNGDATCATAPSIYTSVVAYAPWIAEKTAAPAV